MYAASVMTIICAGHLLGPPLKGTNSQKGFSLRKRSGQKSSTSSPRYSRLRCCTVLDQVAFADEDGVLAVIASAIWEGRFVLADTDLGDFVWVLSQSLIKTSIEKLHVSESGEAELTNRFVLAAFN
ncbi:hypothetical protein PENCOP_c001G06493 [Penicillium coprophilum]|uniref:Uncharacterized protein n=1 Tax=Penicillium coprophilum TaxID=36646 RepID=A0A1V6V9P0_9EURO|nr:hypothetical protein PENCOP_c001G06493 [Penicillium coprophilum]